MGMLAVVHGKKRKAWNEKDYQVVYTTLRCVCISFTIKKTTDKNQDKPENEKRELFTKLVSNVDMFVEEFRSIPDDFLYNEMYMEKFIIEKIGLNNENLWEQPPELSRYYGSGLFGKIQNNFQNI